ncbi:shikimate dehydrogenase [Noviherbaspirillum humi]|uniref:Shikimate dehydrogenase (NADP(+)) n=1 Tax=Noviherbaspirillum humi TaxID=1688639 RepID=A0A239HT20_9BURK|nr:shikimate dehydrogenase [Noviherbaspirillum humi]SNS84480.1 shikimate dehydrogenase [Noviherbaspirillum humi]
MNQQKYLIGLIGAGIQQSLSPRMHEIEAAQHNLRLHYQLIDIDRNGGSVDDLPLLLTAAKLIGFAGLNITYPCKQAVIPLLDELSDEARAVNAVNTVVIRDGRLTGHNTDGTGWAWGFRRQLPEANLDRVVLLGAGGAGAAVADAVLRLGAKHLAIVDQDGKRAEALARRMAELHGASCVEAGAGAERALTHASGLIHATPVGMDKLPGLPLDAALLRPEMWVSEVVYFPLETALLKAARAIGCATADGGGMAVGQAVGAFRLFTGLEPDVARMDAHLRSMVRSRGNA